VRFLVSLYHNANKMVEFMPAERHARATHTKPAAINYVAAIFAALGSFLFGYDSGIIGSVISDSYTHFHHYFGNPSANTTGVSFHQRHSGGYSVAEG
jgi:hypothetical protein